MAGGFENNDGAITAPDILDQTHLKKLMALEESLIENVWNDNNFWPS